MPWLYSALVEPGASFCKVAISGSAQAGSSRARHAPICSPMGSGAGAGWASSPRGDMPRIANSSAPQRIRTIVHTVRPSVRSRRAPRKSIPYLIVRAISLAFSPELERRLVVNPLEVF